MSSRRITQPLVALIVITTLMISVCDSLPKYCQCIESNGNQFSAFAEYFIRDGKTTVFWLYQNKHMCRLSVMNKTDIVIDTSAEILPLDDNYRLWYSFYNENQVYECRAYQETQRAYTIECRRGTKPYDYMFTTDIYEYFYALVFLKETECQPTLPVVLLFQYNSGNGNWRRVEKTYSIRFQAAKTYIVREETKKSDDLSVLLKDIASDVYINAILNDYNAKYASYNGFFIFVTYNGIPMYCYKTHIYDDSDSCKIEKMKPFMRECFTETETTMSFTAINTTISSRTTETLTNNTNTEKPTMNTIMTTEKPNPGLFNVLFIIICIIIIAIIIFIIPVIIWFFRHSNKRDKKQNIDSLSTLSTEDSVKPVKNEK